MIKVYAAIGFIAIFVFIIYIIRRAMISSSTQLQHSASYPPNDYMLNIGSKCPDLWVHTGDYVKNKIKYNICKNTLNVPTGSNCYTDGTNKTTTFADIDSWPIPPSDQTKTLQSRCDWTNRCGPVQGTRASWTGINDKCST